MTTVDYLYEDQYGACIDRPEDDLIEIRWYDTTSDLTGEQFKAWLAGFADAVLARRRSGVLVDSTSFKMSPEHMSMEWRDANIIPKYMAAGVRKFAFHMPEGMPAIGATPTPEGPADFPTGYFGSRKAALAWLGAAA